MRTIVAPSSAATAKSCDRAHREMRAARARRRARASAANAGAAGLRIGRRTAASSSARPPTGRRARNAPAPRGAMPALPASPATLTSSRISVSGVPWRSSWPSAESEATEWISSTYGSDLLDLAALQLADEVPGEVAGYASPCPRDPGRGSRPSSVSPASASTPISSSGTYLTAASIATSDGSRPASCDLALDPVEVGADAGGVEIGELARHLT